MAKIICNQHKAALCCLYLLNGGFMKLPESITKELFVIVGLGYNNIGRISVADHETGIDLTGYEQATIKKISIDIDLPQDFDVTVVLVEQLQARKKKMEADHYVAVKQVEDQIAELLAISDKGEEK